MAPLRSEENALTAISIEKQCLVKESCFCQRKHGFNGNDDKKENIFTFYALKSQKENRYKELTAQRACGIYS